jgi:hypothetical protein
MLARVTRQRAHHGAPKLGERARHDIDFEAPAHAARAAAARRRRRLQARRRGVAGAWPPPPGDAAATTAAAGARCCMRLGSRLCCCGCYSGRRGWLLVAAGMLESGRGCDAPHGPAAAAGVAAIMCSTGSRGSPGRRLLRCRLLCQRGHSAAHASAAARLEALTGQWEAQRAGLCPALCCGCCCGQQGPAGAAAGVCRLWRRATRKLLDGAVLPSAGLTSHEPAQQGTEAAGISGESDVARAHAGCICLLPTAQQENHLVSHLCEAGAVLMLWWVLC